MVTETLDQEAARCCDAGECPGATTTVGCWAIGPRFRIPAGTHGCVGQCRSLGTFLCHWNTTWLILWWLYVRKRESTATICWELKQIEFDKESGIWVILCRPRWPQLSVGSRLSRFHTIWEFGKVQSRCFAKATNEAQYESLNCRKISEYGIKLWNCSPKTFWHCNHLQPQGWIRRHQAWSCHLVKLSWPWDLISWAVWNQYTDITEPLLIAWFAWPTMPLREVLKSASTAPDRFFWQKGFTVDEMSSGIPVAGVEKELVDKPIQNSSLAPWCTIIMILGGLLVGVTSLVANPFCVCLELTEKTPADKTNLSAWLKTELYF